MLIKYKQIVIFCIVLLCGHAISEEGSTSTTEPNEASTESSTISTTTPEVTTTSSTTTSTSTTTTPSTTTTTTPSTTERPTTTPAPITTTAKPAPVPKPTPGTWSYTDNNNQTCLIVQMAIQLKFNYTTMDKKVIEVKHNIPVNDSTVLQGTCNNDTQMIKILSKDNCTFTLTFIKDKENFELSQMEFEMDGKSLNASDDKINIVYTNKTFITPISRSYYCTKEQVIQANETLQSSTIPAQIILSHVQLEAFHTKANHEFSAAKDCEAMETPDIVPIAVGIALAALVVVVLIAYLVARRRSQARGYMSM